VVSVKGDHGRPLCFPWPITDPGISQFAEFGRRPKRLSGFRLAANSFAIDQWAHLRQLGVPAAQEAKEVQDDDRRPKWDTAPPTKKEWKTAINSMKREVSALTEPEASAPFRAPLFPSCLLHVEANLKPKKDFKEATLRTNVAAPVAWRSSVAAKWLSPPSARNLMS
jgi:hypothetical protein